MPTQTPDSPNGQQNGKANKSRHNPALWPLILTACLLAACIACAVSLWARHAEELDRAAAQQTELDALLGQRDELKQILALPPCEAKGWLAPLQKEEKARAQEDASALAAPAPKAPSSAAPSAKNAQTSAQLDAIEQACVFLVAPGGKGSVSTGSGFFVAPGYVVTNKHVVEKSGGRAIVTNKALGHAAPAKIVALSPGKNTDFALLAVEMPAGATINPLPFAREAVKTEKVGAWGFPHLVGKADPAYERLLTGADIASVPELSYTEGVVSAILPREPKIIVHTAPISPGNSGGPLLNEKGEVVGVNTMISLDDSSFRQASIALAVSDLLRFLKAQGALN